MSEQLNSNIHALATKSVKADKPDDAMKYAQAAVNLAHVVVMLKELPKK